MRTPTVLAALLGSLCSCGGEDGGGPVGPADCEEPTGEGTLHADETITGTARWDSDGSPHRVEGTLAVVGASARLEISRCVRVELAAGASLVVGDGDGGLVSVRGEATDPVRFVSAAADPAPGDWIGVRFGPGAAAASRLEHVTVEHAGGASGRPEGDAGILAWGDAENEPSVTLIDVRVVDSASDGISLVGARFDEDSIDLEVTGSAGHPVVLDPPVAGDVPRGAYSGNAVDAIGVRGGALTGAVTWRAGQMPYHVLGDLVVEHEELASLHLSPEAEVWMDPGAAIRVGETLAGTFVAVADPETRVVISGVDGDETPGAWRGIVLGPESTLVQIDSLTVAGAGGADPEGGEAAAVLVRGRGDTGPTVEIHDLRIQGTAGFGLSLLDGATLEDTSSYLAVHGARDYMVHVSAQAAGTIPWELTGADNERPGVLVEPGTIGASAEWGVVDSPYVLAGPVLVEGAPAPLLTIRDGATLRFREGASLVVGQGADGDVRAAGTAATPITFTADAGANPGSWIGILLLSGMGAGTVFSETIVEYGGAPNGFAGETCGSVDAGNFVIVGAEARLVDPPFGVVHDTVIRGSAGYGIALDADIAADLTGERNVFEDNALGNQTPGGC